MYASLHLRAQPARQPLGQHAVERRADQERLDAHLDQPGDRPTGRRWCAAGREHEVTGESGLDRDLRGLVVADLTDEDDVGVGPQDRAQRGGEGQPRLGVRLHLVDAGDAGTRPGPRR